MYDVAVLGAGAAGLCAAINAAERGRSVVLLEKNRRAGVKILMSGGTRCNLTNARGLRDLRVVTGPIDPAFDPRESLGARSIQKAFGDGGAFLGPSLRCLSVEKSVEMFEREGVRTKVEANGKIFPATDRAVDVLDALLRRLGRTSALLRTAASVLGVEAVEEGFTLRLADGEIQARKVIMAVGGKSFPGSGTTGDGYSWARSFGHTIKDPRPALVPIRVGAAWVPDLKGLTVPDADIGVIDGAGASVLRRRESLLFAHFGLTGPAILDVSRAVARWEHVGEPRLRIDFLPAIDAESLDRQLQASAREGRRQVLSILPDAIPKRLGVRLMEAAEIPQDRTGPDLSRDERKRLGRAAKGLELPITGTLGFEKAEVTSGGVNLDEVDPKTLMSLRQPGLYFAGEVLDLDGAIGGYNFQGAWSMGWLAAQSCSTDD
ncbi:NAD(P)/FAD-dependent oxidoreductase [Isosphaeraceae bacterium EP7]